MLINFQNTSHNSTIEKLQVELTTSLELCKSFEETNLKISEELENLKTEMQKPVTLESLEENFYRDKYDEASRKCEFLVKVLKAQISLFFSGTNRS